MQMSTAAVEFIWMHCCLMLGYLRHILHRSRDQQSSIMCELEILFEVSNKHIFEMQSLPVDPTRMKALWEELLERSNSSATGSVVESQSQTELKYQRVVARWPWLGSTQRRRLEVTFRYDKTARANTFCRRCYCVAAQRPHFRLKFKFALVVGQHLVFYIRKTDKTIKSVL